ncbi:MAG: hypothetical protein RIR85_884, partial [Pseudomonadota bacterium]
MELLKLLFESEIDVNVNFIKIKGEESQIKENQTQTKDIFSEKWVEANDYENINKLYEFQFEWFLELYGFAS